MTEKDVWRWVIPKLDNDILFFIYKAKNISCSGFRTNTIRDIKTNRSRIISNLFSKDNYPKLIAWSKEIPPLQLKDLVLTEKEMNELVEIAEEKGAAAVILKLFYEGQEKKAIQLFSFLQEKSSELLKVPDQYIGMEPESESNKSDKKSETEKTHKKQKEETDSKPTASKKEMKKLEQLETKIGNLTKEMEKQNEIHRDKMNDLKKNNQNLIIKLDEKNRLCSELQKDRKRISDEYEEEKNKWMKERDEDKKKIQEMQEELNHFYAKQLYEETKESVNVEASNGYTSKLKFKKKYKILVVGKPANTKPFNKEEVDFVFVEENQVHNYPFSMECDEYWILSYELSNKDQFLLHANDSYSNIDSNKVTICKNFNEVKHQLKHYTDVKEGVM